MFMDVNGQVKSAVRVLELLEYLSSCERPQALRQVVAALGYPKSSAHALLRTLVARGYVQQDDAERYALADGFRDGFSWVGGAEGRLVAMARPIMERMRSELGETVMLAVGGVGGDVKVIAKLVSEAEIRYDTNREGQRPAYCTVMGRVMMAYWEPAAVDAYLARTPLVAHTPLTVTDPDAIRAILKRIRQDGYGVIEEEFAVAGCGAAAPVFDRDGRCAGVLDVATVTPRFQLFRDRLIAGVKAGAAELSRRLGHRPVAAAA
ncbi:MAG: hypothetical protein OHK0024_07680 [Thalassobaculales bacterium]